MRCVDPLQPKMKFITQYLLYTPLTLHSTETQMLMEIKMCVLIEDTHIYSSILSTYFSQSEWIIHKELYKICSQELTHMLSEP